MIDFLVQTIEHATQWITLLGLIFAACNGRSIDEFIWRHNLP